MWTSQSHRFGACSQMACTEGVRDCTPATARCLRESIYTRGPMKPPRLGSTPRTFQEMIFVLQRYWADQGCVILEPYDMEVGAGTFHTATFLRAIGPEPWSTTISSR
jgi:hypothetical protein